MKLYNFIIGELLELANREFRSEEFYKLKDRILKDLGTLSGHNTQHIVRLCHTCGGSGRMPEKKRLYGDAWISKGSPCYRCSGSGKHDEFWVLLEVYKVGSRLFHLPTGRQYSSELFEKVLQSASIVPQKHFEGLIRPIPPRFHLGREAGWWLLLLFDYGSMRSYSFGQIYQYGCIFTPLLLLNNLIYSVSTRYNRIKNSLVKYRRQHCKHEFAYTEDPWASDECRKCGVERWELQENEPIF